MVPMETCPHGNVRTKELNKAGGHKSRRNKKKTFYWISPSEDVTIPDTSWWSIYTCLWLAVIYVHTLGAGRQGCTGEECCRFRPARGYWLAVDQGNGAHWCERALCALWLLIGKLRACVCVCVCVCACVSSFLSTVPVTPNPLHCRLYLAIRACWHCLSSVMCGDSVPMCISMRLSGHPWKNLGKTSLITLGLSRRLSRGAEYE